MESRTARSSSDSTCRRAGCRPVWTRWSEGMITYLGGLGCLSGQRKQEREKVLYSGITPYVVRSAWLTSGRVVDQRMVNETSGSGPTRVPATNGVGGPVMGGVAQGITSWRGGGGEGQPYPVRGARR
ncbi:hypothetical protein R1flu_001982 [Riccia fluitans]|uniref:Uncharacterized protein n=1 Tax=Riccia fluitans TaxID=41844 RepID=A0ABD1Y4U4_9MARC